jgi:hypothetical protein
MRVAAYIYVQYTDIIRMLSSIFSVQPVPLYVGGTFLL